MSGIPDRYRYLTDQPLFAHLATVRPDGSVQSNPMWFEVVGDEARLLRLRLPDARRPALTRTFVVGVVRSGALTVSTVAVTRGGDAVAPGGSARRS